MKRLTALLLALLLLLGLTACAHKNKNDVSETGPMRVAMITDFADITDQSFNQLTYESCRDYSAAHGCAFRYFKPVGNSDEDRVAMIETAIDEGFNVIVMPGYTFAGPIKDLVQYYPDVTFLGIDVGESELGADYQLPSNLVCTIFREEQSGYMAGYAAVKMGYRKLGFLGGMAGGSVKRYGYGFVQGVDRAAQELGLTDVSIKYAYGNQYYGDADITAAMDTWYASGTEIVFSCGASIFTSVAEAAVKFGGKLIGVDVDSAAKIDGDFGHKITETSAVKGIREAIELVLDSMANGTFGEVSGKIHNLGVWSDDPAENFTGLAASTCFNDTFTEADYRELVRAVNAGELVISNDVSGEPGDFAKNIQFEYLGNLK